MWQWFSVQIIFLIKDILCITIEDINIVKKINENKLIKADPDIFERVCLIL